MFTQSAKWAHKLHTRIFEEHRNKRRFPNDRCLTHASRTWLHLFLILTFFRSLRCTISWFPPGRIHSSRPPYGVRYLIGLLILISSPWTFLNGSFCVRAKKGLLTRHWWYLGINWAGPLNFNWRVAFLTVVMEFAQTVSEYPIEHGKHFPCTPTKSSHLHCVLVSNRSYIVPHLHNEPKRFSIFTSLGFAMLSFLVKTISL